jgi:hypothetical protein
MSRSFDANPIYSHLHDRPHFPQFGNKRAVTDRAYRKQLRGGQFDLLRRRIDRFDRE